ncbi:hypothetical protein, partial [Klebsiella pneumoniae]
MRGRMKLWFVELRPN